MVIVHLKHCKKFQSQQSNSLSEYLLLTDPNTATSCACDNHGKIDRILITPGSEGKFSSLLVGK